MEELLKRDFSFKWVQKCYFNFNLILALQAWLFFHSFKSKWVNKNDLAYLCEIIIKNISCDFRLEEECNIFKWIFGFHKMLGSYILV